MAKLIALIATAVMVDGVRTVIQPGEELPPLNKHDATELVASGAAEDLAQTKADEKAAAADAAAADAEFQAARAAVQAADASTGDGAAPPAKPAKAAK